MTKQWLINFSDTNIALFAFFIFLITFFSVLIWTFKLNKKSFYNDVANLPLHDGDLK